MKDDKSSIEKKKKAGKLLTEDENEMLEAFNVISDFNDRSAIGTAAFLLSNPDSVNRRSILMKNHSFAWTNASWQHMAYHTTLHKRASK
jgi:hypothetical protein